MSTRLYNFAGYVACALLALSQNACDSSGGSGTTAPAVSSAAAGAGSVNAVPLPSPDHVSALSGSSVRIAVLGNDRDPDSRAPDQGLRIVLVGQPRYGNAQLDNNGTPDNDADDLVVYVAPPGFTGIDQFYYTVADGQDARASAPVTVTVERPRRTVLRPDRAQTPRNATVAIAVTANDSLATTDSAAELRITPPAHGTVIVDAGRAQDASDDVLVYTPDPDYTGPDSLVYALGDEARAVVDIVVGSGPNAAGTEVCGAVVKGPLAGALVQLYASDELGAPVGLALAQTLTDAAGQWCARVPSMRQPLLVVSSGGTFDNEADTAAGQPVAFGPDEGLQTLLPAGERYAALTVFSSALLHRARRDAGSDDVFDLFAQRRALFAAALGFDPLTSAPGDPSAPDRDAPDASQRYALALGGMANALNTATTRLGLATLSFTLVDALTRDFSDCVLDGFDAGTPLIVDVDGAALAMPGGLNLALETLRFRNNRADLYDGSSGGSFELGACQAPAAAATPVVDATPPVFTRVPAPLALTGDAMTGVAVNDPQVVAWLAEASAADYRDGVLAVSHDAPPVLLAGTTTVSFSASDVAGNVTTIASIVTVSENAAPARTGPLPNLSVRQGTSVAIALADYFNDPEGRPLSFTLAGLPSGTALALDAGTGVLAGTAGAADAAASPLTLTVTASDGGLSTAATMVLTVATENMPPTIAAQAAALSTLEDTPLELTIAAVTVTDPDSTSFSLSVMPGANYTAVGATVTPATDFNGLLRVPVTVSDGLAASTAFELQISVLPVNDAPVIIAQASPIATAEDTALTLTPAHVTVSDPDSGSFTLTVLPGSNYTASGTTLTPAMNFFGTLTVPVAVSDGAADSVAFSLIVNVSAVNDAPVIVTQTAALTVSEDTALSISVNDLQIDDPDSTAFALQVLPGADYTVSGTTITPALDFNGALTVAVLVNDGTQDSAPFNVAVSIQPVDDPPAFVALPAPLPVLVNTTIGPLTVEIGDIDTAPTALLLTAQSADQTLLADANLAVSGSGLTRAITLTPQTDQAGSTTITLTLDDGVTSLSASFDVHVFAPLQDSDGDGLTDIDEGTVHFTDWTDPDSDGDDVRDGVEIGAGGDPTVASSRVTYVDPAGSGSDGLSWATAFQTLQQASADILSGGAPGDPRYVLIGDTRAAAPGQAWSLDLSGASCNQIVLVGSLAPGQTLPLRAADDAPTTLLDVQGYNGSVLTVDGCRDLQVFDVHLRGGDGDLAGNTTGGGAHISTGANATLTDVWISGNDADSMGGGLAVTGAGSLATLHHALIEDNFVPSGDGGGVYVGAGAELVIENSTLRNNLSGNAGGGFFVAAGGMLTLFDALVHGNSAFTSGGLLGGGAGAVLGGLLADRVVLADNRQTRGGGQPGGGALYLENDRSVDLLNSLLLGNFSQTDGGAILLQRTNAAVTLRNSLIAGNASLNGFGGAIHAVGLNSGNPFIIESSTFAYNQAVNGVPGFATAGGIDLWSNANDVTLRDNIVWLNDDDVVGVQTDDNLLDHGAPSAVVAFNNIQDSSLAGANNNVDADPLFEQGFRLEQAGSPSVDAGSQGAAAAGLASPFTTAAAGSGDVATLDQGYHYEGPSAGVVDDAMLTSEFASCLFGSVDLVFVPLIGGEDAGPGRVVQVVLGAGHSAGGTLLSRTALRPYGVASSVLALDRGNGEYRVQVSGVDASPGNRVQLEIRVDSPTATPKIIDSSELDPLFAAAGC